MLAATQGGTHENGRRTWGQSMLVGPWGEMLAQQAEGAGVVIGEVSKARLQEVRQRLPAPGACRTWGVESENRPQRGQFLPDLQAHSPAMG